MNPAPADVPLPYRIVALMQEQNRIFAYPLERLADEFGQDRFRCTRCGACCTRAVNRHIFLLDHDVERLRKIEPGACVPAPDPEFCDQDGVLYVSGYSLRMRDDGSGACWFLESGRCRIYEERFAGCRTYPYMLRRGSDSGGAVTWHRFAHRNRHGEQGPALLPDESLRLAREVMEYENAFLTQQIAFLQAIHEYFTVNGLRHDPAMREQSLRRLRGGEEVPIRVFHAGELERCRPAGSPDHPAGDRGKTGR